MWARIVQPGVGSGDGGGVVWAVGVVRAGWGGVWAVGVVGGVGTHWQPLGNASQVWVVARNAGQVGCGRWGW